MNFPSTSLRTIRARAFAAGVDPSGVRVGELSDTNKIGIQRAVTEGGAGATIYIPVVVSLKEGMELRSMQYRVRVSPKTAGAPNLGATALQNVPVRGTAFVPLIGSLDGDTTTVVATFPQAGTTVKTNEMAIAFLANTSNLRMQEFGTINLISVKIPANARTDDEYDIEILEPSGTSDSEQTRVAFGATAENKRIIKVANKPYVVGDSSPGNWYNAGDFGDGDLDNSDVNNALYATLGVRVPEVNSDVFNAMDVFPLDVNGSDSGGDGQIRFLDWNIILNRSLRIDTNNFIRVWDTNFLAPKSTRISGLTNAPLPLEPVDVLTAQNGGGIWFSPVSFEAQIRQSVEPGATVRVPVVVTVRQDYSVAGMLFVAVVESSDGSTPALSFSPAPGLATGMAAPELPVGQVGYAWPVGSVNLGGGVHSAGAISFTVPAGAAPGTVYTIRFKTVDGAGDINTQYDFESLRGAVVVRGTLPPNPFGRQSDEWVRRFFGRIDNALAHANEDADGDGISNLEEFLAGTHPAELRMHRLAEWREQSKKGFRVKFFAAVGETYIVESAESLRGTWTQVGTGVVGDGSLKEVLDEAASDTTKFYRIRLQR